MSMLKSGSFWLGAAAGIVLWVVVLPKVAPSVKGKLSGVL